MLLETKNISKSFPGVKALENVSLNLREGEVHALVGENGAGKTTLMNIISGVLKPDGGEIKINGKKVEINTTKQALSLGISMIYQEINLVPILSIAENIFIEKIPRIKTSPIVNWKKLYDETEKVLKEVSVNENPRIKALYLSIGQQQMIQLAKAIARDSKIIIMDEPTSSITELDTKVLFKVIKKFKSQKKSIIYISHRLEEIFDIADRVTILRDGKYIDTLNIKDTNEEEIISKMVGRYLGQMFAQRKAKIGDEILSVHGLTRDGVLDNINFSLREGEIVGVYGLIGSGRTELALSLFGVYPIESGEIFINNKKVKIESPRDAIKKGMGYLSEDRKDKSIFSMMDVKENITISSLKKYRNIFFISNRKEIEVSKRFIDKLRIKISSVKQKVMNLSGGNQQKVVVSRLLAVSPRILILDEPTKGIDVGARAEIHSLIESLSENKVATLFISSDLPEVIGISDRIIVMRTGKIVGIFPGQGKTNQETLLKAAYPE